MIIVSLATYPKRIPKLHLTIHTIIGLTLKFDKLFINIPDDLTEQDYDDYEEFKKYDNRIEVYKRDHRWRSANKYVWTYRDYSDATIITCDDDLLYVNTYFLDLYDEHLKNPECIICHEINPMLLIGDHIKIFNSIDLKLRQKEFGKYLTGCCLFPPHCMDGTDLFNFDQFFKMTNACHDEIWFWIMTTLKGIQCIGLNDTWSFDLDGCSLPAEDTALCHINGKLENILKYEDLINSEYGPLLVEKMKSIPCEFEVTTDNLLSYIGNINWLHSLFAAFPIVFLLKKVPKSALQYLLRALNSLKWTDVKVKLNG